MKRFVWVWAPAAALGLFLGCGTGGDEPSAANPSASNPPADASRYVLQTEPAGAKGVREVREDAGDGDEVVMVGRIGGMANPWLDGYAGFTLVDPSVKHCGELGDDGCPKPWDYC